MIRHVISWKLTAEDAAARELASGEIVAALESLPAVIPEIVSLTVGRNIAYPESNWDLVLIADFANLVDVETYRVHPEHEKVVTIIRERVSARSAVDFEL
jgi:hypothetical protein